MAGVKPFLSRDSNPKMLPVFRRLGLIGISGISVSNNGEVVDDSGKVLEPQETHQDPTRSIYALTTDKGETLVASPKRLWEDAGEAILAKVTHGTKQLS